MIYNEREQKLIRLALDPGAAHGELQNAAMMVFKSLKARGIMADALFGNQPPPLLRRQNHQSIFSLIGESMLVAV